MTFRDVNGTKTVVQLKFWKTAFLSDWELQFVLRKACMTESDCNEEASLVSPVTVLSYLQKLSTTDCEYFCDYQSSQETLTSSAEWWSQSPWKKGPGKGNWKGLSLNHTNLTVFWSFEKVVSVSTSRRRITVKFLSPCLDGSRILVCHEKWHFTIKSFLLFCLFFATTFDDFPKIEMICIFVGSPD